MLFVIDYFFFLVRFWEGLPDLSGPAPNANRKTNILNRQIEDAKERLHASEYFFSTFEFLDNFLFQTNT